MQSTVEKVAVPDVCNPVLPSLPTEGSGNVTPGVYHGVSNEDYHAAPGISSSQLKLFLESPKHFEARYITGHMPFKTSKAMERGTLVHMAVLEPELFNQTYTYSIKPKAEDYPDALRSVEDMKAACKRLGLPVSGKKAEIVGRLKAADSSLVFWDDIITDAIGNKTVIDASEYDLVMRMRDNVHANRHAMSILGHGIAEQSVFGYHNETGLPVKCRPDWYRSGIVADLKTCRSAKPSTFARDIHTLKYHVQQAMYQDVCASAGLSAETFAFIAVESEPPHICEVFILNDAAMFKGQELYADAMLALNTCLSSNTYHGYTDAGISELSLPGYAL